MDPGKALGSCVEIIKLIYETAELYRRLEKINSQALNEIALLLTIKDQIMSSRRISNNPLIDNYLLDINEKMIKFKTLIENVDGKGCFKKLVHTRKIEKISKNVGESIKKLKFVLDLKKEINNTAKLDVVNIITDDNARVFWEQNFGSDHTYVQENLFFSAIRMNTNLLTNEIDFLKKVINDDGDEYISAFEFQEWLDFFGDFSVVMRRTIDSLFDTNNLDIVNWYHKSLNKTLVKALLIENLFVIRKHSNQRGIFIVNFRIGDEIFDLYIRNVNKEFVLERFEGMKPQEKDIFDKLDNIKSNNLKDIANSLTRILKPNDNIIEIDWEKQRQEIMDKNIIQEDKSFLEIPGINHLKDGLDIIVGVGVGTVKGIVDTGVGTVNTIVDTGVGVVKGVFNIFTPR